MVVAVAEGLPPPPITTKATTTFHTGDTNTAAGALEAATTSAIEDVYRAFGHAVHIMRIAGRNQHQLV